MKPVARAPFESFLDAWANTYASSMGYRTPDPELSRGMAALVNAQLSGQSTLVRAQSANAARMLNPLEWMAEMNRATVHNVQAATEATLGMMKGPPFVWNPRFTSPFAGHVRA